MERGNKNGVESKVRIVVPLVRKGGVGKTTELLLLSDWLECRNVDWAGYDLDDEQEDFLSRKPNKVFVFEASVRKEMQVAKIFDKAGAVPVVLVDPKAHDYGSLLFSLSEIVCSSNILKEKMIEVTVACSLRTTRKGLPTRRRRSRSCPTRSTT